MKDIKLKNAKNATGRSTTCIIPCHRHQDFYLGDISARAYDKTSLFHLE